MLKNSIISLRILSKLYLQYTINFYFIITTFFYSNSSLKNTTPQYQIVLKSIKGKQKVQLDFAKKSGREPNFKCENCSLFPC